ncbi:integral membrane protein [Hirschia baltica]|uniref:Putative integral membrane protein n=1 Tax=Hirschia baltica (strain ATCC 49814 / DSM 5838 / IFAM 1418) TaxID=582402 RepID=C6XPV5_HIRBI|nr:integral membrane protein [Hirschia baltica]ACT60370.1 putative integral membrane protein [Hirschia baltica ATCC 49814]
MKSFKGLTWDHPRGKDALIAFAKLISRERDEFELQWDVQSLEGFESAPIAKLCEAYDILIIDHPHLGEACAHNCLQPWDNFLTPEQQQSLDEKTVGPSLPSYVMNDQLWALPLDAATQVAVQKPHLLKNAPDTWEDVLALAQTDGRVALSWAGPHAFLSFLSICAAFDIGFGLHPAQMVQNRDGAISVLDLLAKLDKYQPEATRQLNPIGLLEYMTNHDDVIYCPLVYGYVNYAQLDARERLSFLNAPKGPSGFRGSTIGGTGIALSANCTPSPQLIKHLIDMLNGVSQHTLIPENNGQPSLRSAWKDDSINQASGDFYKNTLDTIDTAYVRPRFNGYIQFQSEASQLLRANLQAQLPSSSILKNLEELYVFHKDLNPTQNTAPHPAKGN